MSRPSVRQEAARALSRARAALITREPFFGSLVLGLRLEADETCRQIWTDGTTLGYHPAFAAGISQEKLVGALAHEALHLACGHHARRQHRNPRLWNEACDVVINDILLQAGFRLPEGAVSRPEYSGLPVESVYRELLSRQISRGSARQFSGPNGAQGYGDGSQTSLPEHDAGMTTPHPPSETGQEDAQRHVRSAASARHPAARGKRIFPFLTEKSVMLPDCVKDKANTGSRRSSTWKRHWPGLLIAHVTRESSRPDVIVCCAIASPRNRTGTLCCAAFWRAAPTMTIHGAIPPAASCIRGSTCRDGMI